jgi:hypothetical protein
MVLTMPQIEGDLIGYFGLQILEAPIPGVMLVHKRIKTVPVKVLTHIYMC